MVGVMYGKPLEGEHVESVHGTHFIRNEHPELLRDESSLSCGNCQYAAWPEFADEAAQILSECKEESVPVTISGARTGIAGGAVPLGGAVLSTERLKGITATPDWNTITVQAGETLDSVEEYIELERPGLFYPPDPTEKAASIGGTAATDASGAASYKYGSTRKWITRIKALLPSGTQLIIRRGEYAFSSGILIHPVLGRLVLPRLDKPQHVKNAAGLYITPEMDLIDLFIGSEGKLGLISEADLVLHAKPYAVAEFAVFCNEDQFWALRLDLMNTSLAVREIEAMADTCLGFLQKNTGMSFPACDSWVLLTAIEASCEKDLDTILETLYMLLEENGINADNTWGGFERAERKRLKEFRHLLPETVNRIIAGISAGNRRIHKISTDTAVPALQLQAYFREMRAILVDSGVEYVVFGHAGQGHLHANLIPVNNSQLQEAEQSVKLIAEKAVQAGGTISAEHGTGKLKNHLLELMYSRRELCEMDLLVEAITKC
jgi:D-lactate dehydrogenase (cytochrome)